MTCHPILSRLLPRGLALSGLLALAGCSLAPTEKVAPPATDTHWQSAGPWLTSQRNVELHPNWWTAWHDESLNHLEAQASQANQNLLAADARIEEARDTARAIHASLFPTITMGASSSVNQASRHRPFLPPGIPTHYRDHLLALDASWEPDLWGELSNTAIAADQRARAVADDRAALMLSIQAEVAIDYFNLRGTDQDITQLQHLIKNRQDYLDMIRQMLETGTATVSDVDQAAAALNAVQVSLASHQLVRAQLQHALALLCGEPANRFRIETSQTPLPEPLAANPDLPSALLMRRPDVASAAAAMAAANAQIGAARAAFFPAVNLTAIIGYESTHTSNWFDAPQQLWSFGPSTALTLFDAGRLLALDDQAHATWRESVANWRETVLNAWKEVEDNLTSVHQLDLERQANDAIQAHLDDQLQQASMALKTGTLAGPDWLNTESQQILASITAQDSHALMLESDITLIKALGGGWQAESAAQ